MLAPAYEDSTAHFDFSSRDLLSDYGARLLAWRIEEFWRSKGYVFVRAWTMQVQLGERSDHMRSVYGVRSNIGPDGFPPGSHR